MRVLALILDSPGRVGRESGEKEIPGNVSLKGLSRGINKYPNA